MKKVPSSLYNKEFFETFYTDIDNVTKEERDSKFAIVEEFLDLKKGEKVLDLGTGNGELVFYLIKKHKVNVFGTDYSKEAIKVANELKKKFLPRKLWEKANFSVEEAAKVNFPDNFFDKTVCLDVIEHIYDAELKKVAKEIKRVTKPNGIVVIETAPNASFQEPINRLTKWILKLDELSTEKYHVNLHSVKKFKRFLSLIGKNSEVFVLSNSKNYFSSKTRKMELPAFVSFSAFAADKFLDNQMVDKLILKTPLKNWLGRYLWGKIRIEK